MKPILSYICVLLLTAIVGSSQAIDKITHKCPSPNQRSYATLSIVSNDIIHTPCPTGVSSINGNLRLIDKGYTQTIFPNLPFSIGSRSMQTYTGGFAASVFDNTITGSGNNNFYVGQNINLAIGGAGATNANIYGNLIAVSNRAFSTLIGSTSTIEGVDIFTNIETPTTTGYGVFAYASTGSADAAGTGTISAINGTAGIHLGSANLVNGGEFRIFNAISGTPTTVTTANAVRAYVSNITGDTITNLHGISFDNWTNTATITSGSVIFADSSVDLTGMNYFIDSASTLPARVSGDVFINDSSKGIILKAPDGGCWRFTVNNAGALNAGISVTCP